jgi:hypothetical protein
MDRSTHKGGGPKAQTSRPEKAKLSIRHFKKNAGYVKTAK